MCLTPGMGAYNRLLLFPHPPWVALCRCVLLMFPNEAQSICRNTCGIMCNVSQRSNRFADQGCPGGGGYEKTLENCKNISTACGLQFRGHKLVAGSQLFLRYSKPTRLMMRRHLPLLRISWRGANTGKLWGYTGPATEERKNRPPHHDFRSGAPIYSLRTFLASTAY